MTPRERVLDLAQQIEDLNLEIDKLEKRKKELAWQQARAFKQWRDETARERLNMFGQMEEFND